MSNKVAIGGDRLGSGKKMKIELDGIGRSNFNCDYVWRNTQAPGTLVPFLVRVGLPGDQFEINIESLIKTNPTIGPLLGSFKFQADVFSIPIRLYQSGLHNNPIGVGLKMNQLPLPKIQVEAFNIQPGYDDDYSTQQINPSCILSYLGMKSFGHNNTNKDVFTRKFNAIPYLAYFDIFKNYYANKQEDKAYMLHTSNRDVLGNFTFVGSSNYQGLKQSASVDNFEIALADIGTDADKFNSMLNTKQTIVLRGTNLDINCINIVCKIKYNGQSSFSTYVGKVTDLFFVDYNTTEEINLSIKRPWGEAVGGLGINMFELEEVELENTFNTNLINVNIVDFELSKIDLMREKILAAAGNQEFKITHNMLGLTELINPYARMLETINDNEVNGLKCLSTRFSQEGLLLKTYQNDIFNNYLKSELIAGTGSIEDLTKIDTSEGYFTLDQFNLSSKVYKMLNRIAVSGGTYKDYIENVYDIRSYLNSEIPVFEGGMFQEIVFEEVVNVASTDEPLGSLAGRGRGTSQQGGKIVVKCNEPSYIIGICSITPRIDYSQGNEWDTLLDTLDDLHKPQLDEIGFQDLLSDQMAGVTTNIGGSGRQFAAVGKQPAWINYMTNFNKTFGNFALPNNQMFMTLNRRYEVDWDIYNNINITDQTTYIDPAKFNYIFAQTSRDAMNFWVQLGIRMNVRSVMSSKIMPNL